MVDRFKRSGLTRTALWKHYGVPVATLNLVAAKTRRASNSPLPMVSSEVRVTLSPISSAGTHSVGRLRYINPLWYLVGERCSEAIYLGFAELERQ
jgi:hypothetical protein